MAVLVAYTLCSYPFFIKFFAHRAYQVGFVFLLIFTGALFVRRPRVHERPAAVFGVTWATVFTIAYGLYVVWLCAASLANAGAGYPLGDVSRTLGKVGVAILFFLAFSPRVYRWTLDRYSDVMLVAAVMGLVLVVLVYLNALVPLGTIQLPSLGARDDGIRQFYGLGLGWGSLSLPGGPTLLRLQSFSDEPGTFAFALLAALIWSVFRRRRLHAGIMSAALLLTWSVGAVVAGALLFIAHVLPRKPFRVAAVVLLASFGTWLLLGSDTPVATLLTSYLETKVGSAPGTSLGDRLSDASVVLDRVVRHPLGFGAGGMANVVELSLGVGWLRVLAEAGLAGFACYAVAFAALAWRSARALVIGSEVGAMGAIVLALVFAAFQRARVDESIWHWWLLVGFVRFAVASERVGDASTAPANRTKVSANP